MGNYRQLGVWKRAHVFVLKVYGLTRNFPEDERFGLTVQLRRGAVSIVSNIAEGSGRSGEGEQARFLRIARGSVCEVECQLLLSRDLGYVEPAQWKLLEEDCQTLSRMLSGLLRSFRRKNIHECRLVTRDR